MSLIKKNTQILMHVEDGSIAVTDCGKLVGSNNFYDSDPDDDYVYNAVEEMQEMVKQQASMLQQRQEMLNQMYVFHMGTAAISGDYPSSMIQELMDALQKGHGNTDPMEEKRTAILDALKLAGYEKKQRGIAKPMFMMVNSLYEDAPKFRFDAEFFIKHNKPRVPVLREVYGRIWSFPQIFNPMYLKLVKLPQITKTSKQNATVQKRKMATFEANRDQMRRDVEQEEERLRKKKKSGEKKKSDEDDWMDEWLY